jgi:hypothetical protein
VILIFFCDCSVLGEDRLQGIYTMFVCDFDIICESSDRGKGRVQWILTVFCFIVIIYL